MEAEMMGVEKNKTKRSKESRQVRGVRGCMGLGVGPSGDRQLEGCRGMHDARQSVADEVSREYCLPPAMRPADHSNHMHQIVINRTEKLIGSINQQK